MSGKGFAVMEEIFGLYGGVDFFKAFMQNFVKQNMNNSIDDYKFENCFIETLRKRGIKQSDSEVKCLISQHFSDEGMDT